MPKKSKVAQNLIPSNFAFIRDVDPTHHLGARGESTQINPPPPSCDSVTYKAGSAPAKTHVGDQLEEKLRCLMSTILYIFLKTEIPLIVSVYGLFTLLWN